MISDTTKSRDAGTAASEPASFDTSSQLTGVPELDDILNSEISEGGLVLVAGMTGGGKTVLATQVTANKIKQGKSVRFISTETAEHEFKLRLISNASGIPLELIEMGGTDLAFQPQTLAAESMSVQSATLLDFQYRRDFLNNPEFVLDEILSMDELPGCLILDQLELHGVNADSEGETIYTDKASAAKSLLKRLGSFAHEKQIPVFVFCQQLPDECSRVRKRVSPDQVADFPSVSKMCDVFVGISQLRSTASTAHERTYSTDQFLSAHFAGKNKSIRVTTEFEKQRFLPGHNGFADREKEIQARAFEIHSKSTKRGFVLFRRDVFEKLSNYQNKNCLSVYAYLLLVADWKQGDQNGHITTGQDRIAQELGLDRKQVSAAYKRLVTMGLLERTERKFRRVAVFKLVDFEGCQDPQEPGYFFLARNLRDPSRQSILGNPQRFRIWLAIIHMAQFSGDLEGLLERGQLLYDATPLAELFGDDPGDVYEAMNTWIAEGRLRVINLDFFDIRVMEVVNYDLYQRGEYYKMSNVSNSTHPKSNWYN